MKTLNATDAKREFGEVLLKAQKEPVGINKNGKPVAVIISATEYETLTSLNEDWLKAELQKGMDDINAGRVADGKDVMKRLRKRVMNATV
ncbi:MAG: type II toxin-antitoxin system Phd/YefM family antitoxin [Methylococcales bacterium]|nr:type II toxin-antitoxin system Phd/YefM family antitoxin [Methylococcales bacterium]